MSEQSHKAAIITAVATVAAALITVVGTIVLREKTPDAINSKLASTANQPVRGTQTQPDSNAQVSPSAENQSPNEIETQSGTSDQSAISLASSIEWMIEMLESESYSIFLAYYMHPQDMDNIKKRTTIEDYEKQFAKERATPLLNILKNSRIKKPEFIDENNAELRFDQGHEPIGNVTRFQKVNGFWHLKGVF